MPTSGVEILNVSPFGIWMLANKVEYFLDYKKFPFFKDATVSDIFKVQQPHTGHLYWPELDIDLSLEIIAKPDNFPKVSKQKRVVKTIKKAS